ncbi:hypothetical protein B0H11DRAFT_1915089, partial [Mycena galericulata]
MRGSVKFAERAAAGAGDNIVDRLPVGSPNATARFDHPTPLTAHIGLRRSDGSDNSTSSAFGSRENPAFALRYSPPWPRTDVHALWRQALSPPCSALRPSGSTPSTRSTRSIYHDLRHRGASGHASKDERGWARPEDQPESSSDSEDSSASPANSDAEDLFDPNYIWENGRKIRLLGTLRREREAKIRPLREAREAAKAWRASKKAYPKDRTPRRPWTEAERANADCVAPEERLYADTELLGPGATYAFRFVEFDGQHVLPLIDRTNLVMGMACTTLRELDAPQKVADATEAFDVAARLSSLGGKTGFLSLTSGVRYLQRGA